MANRSFNTQNICFLAQLFLQLARMEEAGLPAEKAFSLIETSSSKARKALQETQKNLNQGLSISKAGYKSTLFNDTDRSLIQAAENTGQLATVYKQLATYYEEKFSRWKKIKSRLYLPCFILVLSLFIQPIPLLISAEISILDYLQLTVGRLVLLGLMVFIVCKLPNFLRAIGFDFIVDYFQLSLLPIKNWVKQRQINQFLMILAMMLEAGLNYSQALPQAVDTIKNKRLRNMFKPAIKESLKGASVIETLEKTDLIPRAALYIIRTGEESGTLSSSLFHFTQLEEESIYLQNELYAEWLPRIVYTIIALWMAYSILSSGAFTPKVDL